MRSPAVTIVGSRGVATLEHARHSCHLHQRIRDHVGLSRPFRFDRTLAALVALVLAAVVAVAALWLALGDALSLQAPRGWYFLYLAGLIGLGLVLARWPRIAAIALCLAALEIGLGFGSALLYKFRLAGSETLFPRNYVRPAYGWHPLLQALPLPTPPDQAGRARVFINSERRRGPERTRQQLSGKIVVALFGGSSTLDFVSPEGKSWPDQLERLLGPARYAVINHGVSGYTTAEHVLQTAFYSEGFGVKPVCALYYVGWNDLRNTHIDGLDRGYADFHLRTMVDAFEARRTVGPLLSVSPTLSLLARLGVLAFDTVRPADAPTGTASAAPDPTLEAIYLRNVRTISAINRERGVTTVWIGQIMNKSALGRDVISSWLPFVRDKDLWALVDRLNDLLRREAAALGDVYAAIPVTAFGPADFADEGHFTPAGSLKFATLLAPVVKRACH